MEGGEAVLVGRVRTDPGLQQPPDLVEVVPGRGLQKDNGGLEGDASGTVAAWNTGQPQAETVIVVPISGVVY